MLFPHCTYILSIDSRSGVGKRFISIDFFGSRSAALKTTAAKYITARNKIISSERFRLFSVIAFFLI